MKLPESFTFSQNNLQDYVDCQYRFLLRHIQHIDWPAVESEPLIEQEMRIDLGFQFHRLVQQSFMGIDPKTLTEAIEEPQLLGWWHDFCELNLFNSPGFKYAEKLISVPFMGFRLVAKFDLLLLHPDDGVTIYDWKTSSRQPRRQSMALRMQSRTYPALLMLQKDYPSSIRISSPGEITMTYWFPSFPDSPITFDYSQAQYESDLQTIEILVNEICSFNEGQFIKTEDPKKCQYCRYRSLCDRGTVAGNIEVGSEEIETDDPFEFDFESV